MKETYFYESLICGLLSFQIPQQFISSYHRVYNFPLRWMLFFFSNKNTKGQIMIDCCIINSFFFCFVHILNLKYKLKGVRLRLSLYIYKYEVNLYIFLYSTYIFSILVYMFVYCVKNYISYMFVNVICLIHIYTHILCIMCVCCINIHKFLRIFFFVQF